MTPNPWSNWLLRSRSRTVRCPLPPSLWAWKVQPALSASVGTLSPSSFHIIHNMRCLASSIFQASPESYNARRHLKGGALPLVPTPQYTVSVPYTTPTYALRCANRAIRETSTLILSQKVCAGRIRTNVPTPGYNIQPLFRILPQHTVALRCAKSLELPQNGFLRGNQR